MSVDPFSAPMPVASAFASADSFRGRLVLIEPTKLELDVPKSAAQPNGPRGNRVTATVTVVDGKGPVQIYSRKAPTGRYLDGPTHVGVWFNQDRLAMKGGLVDPSTNPPTLVKMVLGTLDTYRPGQPAGEGNPWALNDPTEADKQMARDFLANRTVASASAPAPQTAPAPAATSYSDEPPF